VIKPVGPGTRGRTWRPLVGFIAAAFLAGAIGSWATFPSVQSWYPSLQKPTWNPPAWLFGPVWTTLYLLMGIAAWRVWRSKTPGSLSLVTGYWLQLGLNAAWSVLFFGLRRPGWALVDIGLLWTTLTWLQVGFARTDRIAAALWLPYWLWVSFASALNFAIVRLN
jgi:tryptophan-rich sensory protein